MDLKNISILKDWEEWKMSLGKLVNFSESIGMSDTVIDSAAYQVGRILTSVVDPENREERLLQQLWRSGTPEERKVLAKLVVKLVKNDEVKH